MSCPAAITPAILDTILARLALLFLAGADGDLPTARHAASRMLAAYHAETPDELRLAAEIISFGLHALEALGQASAEGLALNRILRLRGSAVSLSRESHKAQGKLDQLQRDRRARASEQAETAVQAQAARPEQQEIPVPAPLDTPLADASPPRPRVDAAISLVESGRETIQPFARHDGKNRTKAFQPLHAAQRITENLKRNQALHIAALNPAHPATVNGTMTAAIPG